MSRYVEIDALIEDLQYDIELDARTLDDLDFVDAKARELVELDKSIKQNIINIFGILRLPPADVRENVHAHWVRNKECAPDVGEYECSHCHRESFVDTDFCPNCGADMGGEDE